MNSKIVYTSEGFVWCQGWPSEPEIFDSALESAAYFKAKAQAVKDGVMFADQVQVKWAVFRSIHVPELHINLNVNVWTPQPGQGFDVPAGWRVEIKPYLGKGCCKYGDKCEEHPNCDCLPIKVAVLIPEPESETKKEINRLDSIIDKLKTDRIHPQSAQLAHSKEETQDGPTILDLLNRCLQSITDRRPTTPGLGAIQFMLKQAIEIIKTDQLDLLEELLKDYQESERASDGLRKVLSRYNITRKQP